MVRLNMNVPWSSSSNVEFVFDSDQDPDSSYTICSDPSLMDESEARASLLSFDIMVPNLRGHLSSSLSLVAVLIALLLASAFSTLLCIRTRAQDKATATLAAASKRLYQADA